MQKESLFSIFYRTIARQITLCNRRKCLLCYSFYFPCNSKSPRNRELFSDFRSLVQFSPNYARLCPLLKQRISENRSRANSTRTYSFNGLIDAFTTRFTTIFTMLTKNCRMRTTEKTKCDNPFAIAFRIPLFLSLSKVFIMNEITSVVVNF